MFETPLFLLAALIGGLIPLLLHMRQRRHVRPRPFPTLRFLREAQKASARRARIEHLLLWLLRTLIMVLLGAAFAMPVLRAAGGGGLLGRAPRDIAIVLDMSFSMSYQTGRGTAFEAAVETAIELIEGLGENDRFLIVLAGRVPRALIAEPIGDKATGIAQLRALRFEYDTSRLLPAIDMARDSLREAAGRRPTELHVLTDNQALAWRGEGAADAGAAPAGAREATVFVTLTGAPAPENLTPAAVTVQPPLVSPAGGARVTVELGLTGPARETAVTFFVNDREAARRAVTAGAPLQEPIRFTVPPLSPGVHTARIETPADNLVVDDTFHLLLRVRDTLPVLVCGTEADTFFLRAALRASGDDAVFSVIAPDALAGTPLSGYAVLFLCNALPLSGQVIASIEQFVRRGGLLAVLPGSRAAAADYAAWQSMPGTPRAIRDVPRSQARQSLLWNEPDHPVLQGLEGALAAPVVAVQRMLVWDDLPDETRVLIATGEGEPFLLERPHGEGRVLLFAVSADRSWSNFPLTPFYLPIAAQLVEFGSGLGAAPAHVQGDVSVALDRLLPDAEAGIAITGPDGRPVPVRSVMQDGQPRLLLEDIRAPGIYTRRDTDPARPAFAVNLPREESDLTPVDPDTLAALLGGATLHVATDAESLAALLREHRIGRTFGELLLWLVLVLMATEFVYANRLARGHAPLSATFTVETSGRVRAGAGDAPKGAGGRGWNVMQRLREIKAKD